MLRTNKETYMTSPKTASAWMRIIAYVVFAIGVMIFISDYLSRQMYSAPVNIGIVM
ncbi:MAG: hypothetical protein QOD94_1464, partial [Alphaproteobacteria bacterium]|nr:hypothetical protein [Alphaproteobacteria bacterium]